MAQPHERLTSRLIARPTPVLWAIALAIAAYAFTSADSYSLRVLTVSGCYALMVLGYQFIFGHAGALSLAQGTFFGLGAYVTGLLGSQWGAPFPITFPLSIAFPVLIAAAIAIPVLRLESHYFALATLGISQVALITVVDWENLTGGSNGLTGFPGIAVLGAEVQRGLPLLLFVWGAVGLGAVLAWQIMRGLYGTGFAVLRSQPLAARGIGLNSAARRFSAFVLSAAYGGAAGALFIHGVGVVSPEVLGFPVMVACLSMAVIGGRTRVAGAILGAVLLIHLPEWFRFLEQYYLLAYGAGVLLVVVLAPEGLVGLLDTLWRRLVPEGEPSPPPTSDRAAAPRTTGASRGASTSKTLVSVRAVSKNFGGVAALTHVNLSIQRGEVFGLIGPNGSGKTTLVNLMTGYERPDAGMVMLGGRTLTGMPTHRIARAGLVRTFQTPALVDDLTALDNVAAARSSIEEAGLWSACRTPGRDHRLDRARKEAMARLEQLGIEAAAMEPCGKLPHAARRLIEVARAIAVDPTVLILDEPAAGLTEAEQRALADRLRDLADAGLALLVVDHNMPFLSPLADRMACLDEGRKIAEGTPASVVEDRTVVDAYLGRFTTGQAGSLAP